MHKVKVTHVSREGIITLRVHPLHHQGRPRKVQIGPSEARLLLEDLDLLTNLGSRGIAVTLT